MAQSESIGLFLGAGASFELGMPLVRGLTGEFKGYFTPEHLRELNAGWRQQGGGYGKTFPRISRTSRCRLSLRTKLRVSFSRAIVRSR